MFLKLNPLQTNANWLLKHPLLLFLIILGLYLLAVPVDIMEVDSAQYASMAREMLDRGDFLHVVDRGAEYLDKPPFIFWISAFFYTLLGVSEFAFKLPSILFSILGVFAVFRFTRLFYSERTAWLAALILATTQGYFHFNNDVRTDTYLTNSVITSVWMLSEFLQKERLKWLIGASVFIGIAMLAKGPLGLLAPGLAFSTHFLLKRQWKQFFKWQWLIALLIVLFVLSPMLIGLYEQFDLQPTNVVNGKTGVSGLRFFFWEQSFGRITGENVWKNDTGPFFFVHNLAWSFLPWTLAFLFSFIAVFSSLLIRGLKKLNEKPEWISFGGFLLPFLALSASNYKLPHYIYVTFPFAAVLTADFLSKLELTTNSVWLKRLNVFQIIVLSCVWIFAAFLFTWFFPLTNPILIAASLIGLSIFIWSCIKRSNYQLTKYLWLSLTTCFTINLLMATQFYPSILVYQAPGLLGKDAVELGIPLDKLYHFNVSGRSMDVYTHSVVKELHLPEIEAKLMENPVLFIHTNQDGKLQLESNYNCRIIKSRDNYPVTLLSMNFGNPKTRPGLLEKRFLLEVKRKN